MKASIPENYGRPWGGRAAALLVLIALVSLPIRQAAADTVTLDATADTWIDAASDTTNHGSDMTLQVKALSPSVDPETQRTLVKFDLSAIGSCASVTSATLRLYVESNSYPAGVQHSVHPMLVSWNEGEATWLLRDATHSWGSNFDALKSMSSRS
jgi:hypothetical protein